MPNLIPGSPTIFFISLINIRFRIGVAATRTCFRYFQSNFRHRDADDQAKDQTHRARQKTFFNAKFQSHNDPRLGADDSAPLLGGIFTEENHGLCALAAQSTAAASRITSPQSQDMLACTCLPLDQDQRAAAFSVSQPHRTPPRINEPMIGAVAIITRYSTMILAISCNASTGPP